MWRNPLQALHLVLVTSLVAGCGGGSGGGGSGGGTTSTVTPPAATLSYGSPNYQYTVGIAATTLMPGKAASVKTWSVSPALPAGLALDTATGDISGTPTTASPTANYVVTGITSAGQQMTADLKIGVTSNVVLNLGDVASLQYIQFDAAHVLTQDATGHWILWDYATAAQIASGVSLMTNDAGIAVPSPIALAGPTLLFQTTAGFESRSSSTGEVLGEVTIHAAWWELAPDGSYLCAGNGLGVTCWSPSGQQLMTESGNYENAEVLALPGTLLVALGAAGRGVIETVSTATWTSTVGPAFQGAFSSWFTDGSGFLTTIPEGTQIGTTIAAFNTLFVYSPSSVLEETETMPTVQGLTGQGGWFWTAVANTVTLYPRVNNTATCMPIPCTMPTPTAAYALAQPPVPIGTFILAVGGSSLTAIDLSGAMPVVTGDTLPLAPPSAFAAISPSQYIEGLSNGVIIAVSRPNSPVYFGHGALKTFAGSNTRVVFTTATGETFSYNLTTNAFETIAQLPPNVRQVALSTDGSVLADVYGTVAANIDVFSMPSGTLINSFPPQAAPTIGLSADGALLTVCCTSIVPVTGGAATLYPFGLSTGQLSPDGTSVAVSDSVFPGADGFGVSHPTTNIYKNGALVGSVPGWSWVLGWRDDSSIVVSTFSLTGPLYTNGEVSDFTFNGDMVYSATGELIGPSPIGANYFVQFAPNNLVFANYSNTILSATTGAVVWASADPPVVLAVGNPVGSLPASFFTGSAVVFSSGNLVLTQQY